MPKKKGPSSGGDGANDIFKLVKDEDMDGLHGYLQKHAGAVSQKNKKHQTPLHLAVQNMDNGCVDVLLASKADTNAQDKEGKTPLHEAVIGQNDDLVGQLLANGADPSITDQEGCSSLHWAARLGFAEVVDVLLGDDELPGTNTNEDEEDQPVSKRVAVNKVKLLLAADKQGNTPIHYAASEESSESMGEHMVNILASELQSEMKAKINVQNNEGYTPMHLACSRGLIDLINLLLNFDADFTLKTNEQQTILHLAAVSVEIQVLEVLSELISEMEENGRTAFLNALDKNNNTALYYAAEGGNKGVVGALLQQQGLGLDINIKCADGLSAIAIAHQEGHKDIVAMIEQRGGNRSDLAAVTQKQNAEEAPKRGDYTGRDKSGIKDVAPKPKPPPMKKRSGGKLTNTQLLVYALLILMVGFIGIGLIISITGE